MQISNKEESEGKEEEKLTAKMKRTTMGPRNEGQRGDERKREV